MGFGLYSDTTVMVRRAPRRHTEIVLGGVLRCDSLEALNRIIAQVIDGNDREIRVDLGDATYVSCSVAGALASAAMTCNDTGVAFRITKISDTATETLQLLGVYDLLVDIPHYVKEPATTQQRRYESTLLAALN